MDLYRKLHLHLVLKQTSWTWTEGGWPVYLASSARVPQAERKLKLPVLASPRTKASLWGPKEELGL